ncbi:hypothetical protein Q7P35_005497 [Cladosporium inversicolor]
MQDTLRSHTSSNIADHLFDVLKVYQISGSQIAFFVADNATNNDKALKLLSERVELNPITSRLRCAGHVFNLVCTTILFGVYKDALKDAEYDFSQPQDDSTSGTQEESNMHADDLLTKDDWEELAHLRDLLAPIHEVSKHVQSVGTTAGALHNTLTSMDYLLHHFETRRKQPGSKHFIASLNVCWTKLRKYYQATDLNPFYIMAVFLNPYHRDFWLEDHWEPAFVTFVLTITEQQYVAAKRLYNIDAPERKSASPQSHRKELTGFAVYNKRRSHPPEAQDPLDWWLLHQDDYPVLKHLAFTLLAALASTSTDERLFIITGNVVNEERPHTQQALAERVQCLRL